MAECSSKSDEYGRDDGGNTYPSLHAMLVCLQLRQCLVLCTEEGPHSGTPVISTGLGPRTAD